MLLSFICFSCNQEENNEAFGLENHGVNKINLRDSNASSYNYFQSDFETPSNELLDDIFDLMRQQNWWDDFVTHIESNNYSIKGNFATIDRMGTDDYVIFIPIKDRNKHLVSLLKYSTVVDHGHFSYEFINDIMDQVSKPDVNDIPSKYISFILKLYSYQKYLYAGASNEVISCIRKYIEANPDKINTRKSTESYWVYWSDFIDGGESVHGLEIQTISACNIGGTGGGGRPKDDWTTGGSGSSNSNVAPSLSNVLLKYPSLVELKDCMEEHASSDLIAFLTNGIENLECTIISEEELYDAIKTLCDKNSDSVSFSGIEGNNSAGASFTLDDLKDLLPEDDYIDFSTLKKECRCLYDYLTNNVLGTENENWLCEIIKTMQNALPDDFTQQFHIGNQNEFRSNVDYSGGNVIMLIPRSACDGTYVNDNNPNGIPSVQIGAEFIHEFLHSYLAYLWHKDNGSGLPSDFYIYNNNGDLVPNTQYYIELVESFADGDVITGDQHVLFYTHLKNLILNSLHMWNGGEGDPEDYEYYFHILINTSNLAETNQVFAQAAGFRDANGNNTFDLSSYLTDWTSTGGNADGTHSLFNANCN